MRLIDADKLKKYYSTEIGYVQKNEDINQAETVDAIPVEFIDKKIGNSSIRDARTLRKLIINWRNYNSRDEVKIENWHLTSEGDFPTLCGDYFYTIQFEDGRTSVGYKFLGPEGQITRSAIMMVRLKQTRMRLTEERRK